MDHCEFFLKTFSREEILKKAVEIQIQYTQCERDIKWNKSSLLNYPNDQSSKDYLKECEEKLPIIEEVRNLLFEHLHKRIDDIKK